MQGVAHHFSLRLYQNPLSIKIEYNQDSRQAHYYVLDAFHLKRNDGLVSNLKEHINNFLGLISLYRIIVYRIIKMCG